MQLPIIAPQVGQLAQVAIHSVIPHVFGLYCEFSVGAYKFGAIIEQAHQGLEPEFQVLVDNEAIVTVEHLGFTETTPPLEIVAVAI